MNIPFFSPTWENVVALALMFAWNVYGSYVDYKIKPYAKILKNTRRD